MIDILATIYAAPEAVAALAGCLGLTGLLCLFAVLIGSDRDR